LELGVYGLWFGIWILNFGNGKWEMGNGKWEMGNGKWEMGNGNVEYLGMVYWGSGSGFVYCMLYFLILGGG
jgi:hypothetical protein